MQFDDLAEGDVDAAVALSAEADWNQTDADWRRLLALSPGGCLAGRIAGELVATATVVRYGPGVRWIGMVLVARAWRGRGFGTAMLERIVPPGGGAGVVVGLDATDLGRPLYLGLGFADVAAIDRWEGTLRPTGHPAGRVEPLRGRTVGAAMAFDRQACGLDRRALLAQLMEEPETMQWVALDGDRAVGLACLRPGRIHWHLGPIVCEDSCVLQGLLASAAGHLGNRSVLVDAVRDDVRSAVLGASGLRVQRRLTRMTRPHAPGILSGAQVAAATAFEWG